MKKLAVLLLLLFLIVLTGCGAMSPEATATAPSQAVSLGDSITLSAADSDKKNGETLRYRWTILSAPAGSVAQLSDAASATPTFSPDQVGEYVFSLVVNNDYHDSEPVEIKLTCTPAPILPVTNATDPSGLITLQDLTAVENFRTATLVNYWLKVALKNAGPTRANLAFTVRGLDQAGAEVYAIPLGSAVNANETRSLTFSLPELPVSDYDSVTTWTIDPITLVP